MNFVAALAHLLLGRLNLLSDDSFTGSLDKIKASQSNSPRIPTLNYQIDSPTADYGSPVYQHNLFTHEFGASWGQPYTVEYSPPPDSVDFSHVKLLLEVSSFGIQYDRLAHLYLNSIEIWRPSTSEPRGRHSYSNYTKDVSTYRSLFLEPGQLSFELNNLVTERLNGTFSVALSALYYDVPGSPGSHSPNEWYEHEGVPATSVSNVFNLAVATGPLSAHLPSIPRNTTRAVLQVFASGNGNDEFWYAEESTNREDHSKLPGPIRHIVVNVDNDLAGTISPFYQIYTGGYQPNLWSPFVAPNAYDVPSYEIDITPFLPSLWEENSDVPVEIFVTDGFDNLVHHEWIISAALHTWEAEGIEGSGTRYPTLESNTTSRVQLPNLEVTDFSQSVNVTSELFLHGTKEPSTRVEWIQDRKVSGVIVGGTVITHSSQGKSLTSYASRNYSRAHDYDVSLVLGETDIVLAEGYSTHDAGIEPTSSADILSRTHSVHYNGSWFFPEETSPREHDDKRKCNGSDVFVRFRDPLRTGPETYHQHAVSRNGSVITFDKDSMNTAAVRDYVAPSEYDYLAAVIESGKSIGGGFPFVSLSEDQLDQRHKIRQKWLKHGI